MIRRLLGRVVHRVAGRTETPKAAPRPVPTTVAPATVDDEPDEEPMIECRREDLVTWREEGRELVLLDIRELHELRGGMVEGAWACPMNMVPAHADKLPKETTLVVYCAAGVRSWGVTNWLREQGFEDTWSLVGGAGGR